MSPILAALLVAHTPELAVAPPIPIAVQLSTPSTEPTRVAPHDVLAAVLELFAEQTDLSPVVISPEEAEGCAGDLVCMVRRSRAKEPVSLLLIVSVLPRPDASDLATAILFDPDRVLSCEAEQPDAVDLCTAQHAVLADLDRTPLEGPRPIEPLLDALSAELRSVVPARVRKLVEIDVSVGVDGTTLLVDGAPVGSIEGRSARLVRVPAGRRIITARHPQREDTAVEVELVAGEQHSVSLDRPEWHPRPLRRALFWTGIGTAVAGASIAIWSIVFTARLDDVRHCSPNCDRSELATLEQVVANDPVRRGSVLALPLGYSSIGAGAAWSLGAELGDSEIPWLEALIGLGVGVLAYGVSALAHSL